MYDLCQALGVEPLRKTWLPKTSVRIYARRGSELSGCVEISEIIPRIVSDENLLPRGNYAKIDIGCFKVRHILTDERSRRVHRSIAPSRLLPEITLLSVHIFVVA